MKEMEYFQKINVKKCSNCGAELPRYSNYEYDLLDSRGYSEVWICPKCRKHHKRGDFE